MADGETEHAALPGDPGRRDATAAATATASTSGRVAAARRLAVGGRGSAALDRLSELAALLLGTTSAQVSVISEVQHVAGGAGLGPDAVGSESPAAESLCTVTVGAEAPVVVARAADDARVASLPPVTSGAVGSYLGVPLVADDGHVVGALCVFDPQPRTWSDADVALLQHLAGPVIAELELAALTTEYEAGQMIWQLAMDAAGVGAFDWNLETGELRWDDRLLELFGYDHETFGGTIESFTEALHPDDLERVTEALRQAIQDCGEYVAEYRVVLPGGGIRWIGARGRALCGEAGRAVRLLGAAFDTTAVQEGEARVARVLESMPSAFYHVDRDWRFSYVNAEAERLLGASRTDLVGGVIWDIFPAAVASDFEQHFRHALASGEPVTFEAYYPPPLDNWYELRAWPSTDGLSVYFYEITEQRAARVQVEGAARRGALLADVAAELGETLDSEDAVGRLAGLVVPDFADWCLVTMVRRDAEDAGDWKRGLQDVGCSHRDPAMKRVLEEFAEVRLSSSTDRSRVVEALAEPDPVVVPIQDEQTWHAVFPPGRARDLLDELAPTSAVFVPMRARGRTVGLLNLFRGAGREPFGETDVATLREVADRAGLALDNARLYAAQRELAEGLQRSLLTPPPEPDHLEVAVRYLPAAEVAQVGGDWYDAFLQRDGATVVVIGDVVGHDTAAAAAMGQVRSLLRAIAVHSGDGPAEVLVGVDRAMETLQVDTTATAIVARLEQSTEERDRLVTRLRWSNAGHPPPLVINPDGSLTELATFESDLLLGLDPDTRRVESVVTLDRGATLLLFTDGLVERHGQSLDEGLARLRDTLGELARQELTLTGLCDELLSRMFPERADDDVALVAVRLHRQDLARPPEAGPNRRVPPEVD